MSSDCNLLFGILALQMDFISRDALLAAMNAWVLAKDKSIGQILRAQGALSEEHLTLLAALVQAHLKQHSDDPQRSLASLSSIGRLRQDLHDVADADVQASLPHVATDKSKDDHDATTGHTFHDTVGGRFQVLRPHAKGGLGEVFIARDTEVDREVALKEIQAKHAGHADNRARFLLEAKVTGALEHPGIVPVYGLGHYADGRPFYAMRFIKGDSLKDALAEFHASKGQFDTLTFRKLLGRFVDVCQAIAYAHSRGVLHRDLKPGNIMLGKYGETLVVDWGLAKVLGHKEGEATESALATSTDSGLTQAGKAMGTPAYMSPEQAAGKLDLLGPRSDVYSLGATLYCLLTGQPPITETTVGVVLARTQKGDFPLPRKVNPRVPLALEAICLRAMALAPEDRYALPHELADEVERFLADEPVKAHREPWLARAGRWVRKHQTLTAGVGALLLTGVIALGVSTLLIGNAQRTTAKALENEATARENLEQEQRQRALAQVNALGNASAGAVPGILVDLEANRAEVLPRLRELWNEKGERGRHMRLALALLPVEPDKVRDELLSWMLRVEEPAEVLLVRDALKPHGAELKDRLWAKSEDGSRPGERFRALVALAAFDPRSPRWTKAAPGLLSELLTANPLYFGAWVGGLRPVRDALVAPLGEVYRGKTLAEHRQTAALVLADYASDKPEVLLELLLDADGKQYATLKPALERYREQAAVRMKQEMAAKPDVWKDAPLEAKWGTAPAEIVREVEAACGMVAERFALCQALPWERLVAVTEGLRAAGYRPLRVRPYDDRVAIVWTRDGREWELEPDAQARVNEEPLLARRAQGWVVAEVAGYRTKDGDRYLVLWRKGDKGEETRAYAGVPAADHQAHTDKLKADGYLPQTIHGLTGADGVVRYSGVWGKRPEVRHSLDWDQSQAATELAADQAETLLLDLDVAATKHAGPEQYWRDRLARAERDLKAKPTLDALYSRGAAYYMLGRDAEALKDMTSFLAKKGGVNGLYYRALLHARAGRLAEARQDAAAHAKTSTDERFKLELRARVELHAGNDAVLKEVEQAVAADNDQDMHYTAARIYGEASRLARLQEVTAVASLVASPTLWSAGLQSRSVSLSTRQREKQSDDESSHSRASRAFALLEQAVKAGYGDFAAIESDPSLEPVWRQPAYRALAAKAGSDRRYATAWQADPSRQATSLIGLMPDQHLARSHELAAQGYRPAALSLGAGVASSVWHRPVLPAVEKEHLARRQATAAATLLHLRETEPVWPVFQHSPDPTVRSFLVQRSALLGVDPKLLVQRLLEEKDDSARRALIVALGDFTDKELPPDVRGPLVKQLLLWYRDDPDAGVHGTIDWLLRHGKEGPVMRPLDWGQRQALEKIDKELMSKPDAQARGLPEPDAQARDAKKEPDAQARDADPLLARRAPQIARRWYVNTQGQTFTRIPGPVTFRMGSPPTEPDRVDRNEKPHTRRISRNFAIATKAVTVAQWERFVKEHPEARYPYTKRYSPEADGPIIAMNWYEAAQYCNWLSQKEGLPEEQWCYRPNEAGRYGPGMKVHPDYLERTGYRLPTEAEWEYACRAGSAEERYYGSSIELLPRYALYQGNASDRAWPAGQKRPNDLGLFDMQGNVWTWCQDIAFFYPQRRLSEDKEDIRDITDLQNRVLRGGSFVNLATNVRSASRLINRPDIRTNTGGLRPARTYHLPLLPSYNSHKKK